MDSANTGTSTARLERLTGTPANARTGAAGALLKAWRTRRHLSQLALALETGVSPRHLSFVETGRSRPSAELLMVLAAFLDVPLRQRNELLLAAGYAPHYPEHRLDSPDLATACNAIARLLAAHDPWPGIALDRHWNIVLTNAAASRMTTLLPSFLSKPVINVFRASLHPQGFAAVTTNFDDWARYLLSELERLHTRTADQTVEDLLDEVRSYPNVAALLGRPASRPVADGNLLVPCELDLAGSRLSFFTTLMSFGSPRDVTLEEMTVELFYPSDEATAAALRGASAPV